MKRYINSKKTLNGMFLLVIVTLAFLGCKKDWLEIKPQKRAIVFTTLSDYQAIVDNIPVCHAFPLFSEAGGNNFFYNEANLAIIGSYHWKIYSWLPDGKYEGTEINDWSLTYKAIFGANTTLEGLKKIGSDNMQWNSVYGTALFIRGTAFFNLANLFAAPYDPSASNSSPGIPLKLESDININVGRGTVKQTYDQIIADLVRAIEFLPEISGYQIRPTKQTGYGMLARIYLAMGDYPNALLYADKYLTVSANLINYNTLPTTGAVMLPEPQNNPEVKYYAQLQPHNLLQNRADIDPALFSSYSSDDLRKSVFFRTTGGRNVWAGSYTGSISTHFVGIATDEIYLIRSECRARNGQTLQAMADLNLLLKNRYKTGTYIEKSASTKEEALDVILAERRKELPFRGLRWSDIRRLNREPRYATTIKRTIAGVDYFLTPNDKKLIYPIPDGELLYNPLEQNPR